MNDNQRMETIRMQRFIGASHAFRYDYRVTTQHLRLVSTSKSVEPLLFVRFACFARFVYLTGLRLGRATRWGAARLSSRPAPVRAEMRQAHRIAERRR